MIALIQRVSSAQVHVENEIVGEIEQGILAFLGVEKEDTKAKAERLLQRVLGYRIFADDTGRMNRSLRDINGGLLVVSQFTLPADTRKGMRPSFSSAAPPALGEALYDYFLDTAQKQHDKVASGIFAADMRVSLANDGPVTFWLTV